MQYICIASVNGRQCTTTDGRAVIAIGNKNISAGDYVWEDGGVVFGNEQRGGVRTVITEGIDGIPCLLYSDKETLSSLSANGKENTMINMKQKYFHTLVNDEQKFFISTSAKVYDRNAEPIASVGENENYNSDLLDQETSQNGIYRMYGGAYFYNYNKEMTLKQYYFAAHQGRDLYEYYLYYQGKIVDQTIKDKKEEQKPYDRKIGWDKYPNIQNKAIRIFENDTVIKTIDLQDYADIAEKEAINYAAQQDAGTTGEIYPAGQEKPAGYTRAKTVKIISATLDQQGGYEILLDCTAERIFFPWLSYRGTTHYDKHEKVIGTAARYDEYLNLYWDITYKTEINTIELETRDLKSYGIAAATVQLIIKITNDTMEVIGKNSRADLKYTKLCGEIKKGDQYAAMQGIGNSVYFLDSGTIESEATGAYRIYDICTSNVAFEDEKIFIPPKEYEKFNCTANIAKSGNEEKKIEMKLQDAFRAVYDTETQQTDIRDGTAIILKGFKDFALGLKMSICKLKENQYLLAIRERNLYLLENGSAAILFSERKIGNFRLRKIRNLDKTAKKIKKLIEKWEM